MTAAFAPQVPLQLPVKLLPTLKPKRFKVLYGGRGGAKSHTVAQVLLMLAMQRKLRVLCVREVQKTLKQSSMQVIKDYIERLGLGQYCDCLKTEIRCLLTGSTFEFTGLKDHTADSIKSYEGVDIVWVEEAHSVSPHSWTILIPTIRKNNANIWGEPSESEIWITFNPDQEADYVYDRFVKNTDPDAIVIEINFMDNPWFGGVMDKERCKLKAINDDLYGHVWLGKCRSSAGLLFKRVWFEHRRFDLGTQPNRLNRYIASDYAGGPDPDKPENEPDWTEHGCAGLDDKGNLWFVDWWSGQEDPNEWIKAWLGMVRRNKALMAFEEMGSIRRSVDGAINKAMREAAADGQPAWVKREGLPSVGSKASRALGFAARASAGSVWIPNTEWGDRLINQLCAFNGQDGRTDDMVDVCTLLARGLDNMVDADSPPPPPPPPPPPFTEAWYAARDAMDQADEDQKARYYR